MDGILYAILVIAVFPALAFCYGHVSNLVQLIFNKNFDEPALKAKWQLNSYASYSLIMVGFVNFFNAVLIHNIELDFCINVALVIGSYWYLGTLFKHHILSKTA